MEETDEKLEKLEEQIKKQEDEKNRLHARREALDHQLTAGGMQQPALTVTLQSPSPHRVHIACIVSLLHMVVDTD